MISTYYFKSKMKSVGDKGVKIFGQVVVFL
jgi:hypothetical protein